MKEPLENGCEMIIIFKMHPMLSWLERVSVEVAMRSATWQTLLLALWLARHCPAAGGLTARKKTLSDHHGLLRSPRTLGVCWAGNIPASAALWKEAAGSVSTKRSVCA